MKAPDRKDRDANEVDSTAFLLLIVFMFIVAMGRDESSIWNEGKPKTCLKAKVISGVNRVGADAEHTLSRSASGSAASPLLGKACRDRMPRRQTRPYPTAAAIQVR